MSKVDAQRAMKAARLARTAPEPVVRPTPRAAGAAAPAAVAPAAGPAPAPGAATCGHRNMAGKECVRPSGHSEKSHRYS